MKIGIEDCIDFHVEVNPTIRLKYDSPFISELEKAFMAQEVIDSEILGFKGKFIITEWSIESGIDPKPQHIFNLRSV